MRKIRVYVYPTEGPYKHHVKDILTNPIGDEYFTWVTDPGQADFFYSPIDLGKVFWDAGVQGVWKFVGSLPYFSAREHRHFFHDYSAESGDWGLPSVLFRAVKSRHDPNPRTISVPHWVDDLNPTPVDFRQLSYDICFVGRIDACAVRRAACESVKASLNIRSFMIFRDTFWGYTERDFPVEAQRQRDEFIWAMKNSMMVLSPKGVELDAYRTWESMSAGRVPVWIGDEYELPYKEFVNYDTFMFQFVEANAPIMGSLIEGILAYHSPDYLRGMGQLARDVWFQWFRKEAIPKVYHHYLEKLNG